MNLVNNVLILVVFINFFMLSSSRLVPCIRAVSLQGALLALLPLLTHGFTAHTVVLSCGALALKGIIIPRLLLRTIEQVGIRRELEPIIGYVPTTALGAVLTSASFLFANQLPLLPEHVYSRFIPVSLRTLSSGLLLLMTLNLSITHVLGYLVLENGIYIFGILLLEAMPTLVEAGVLLDLLVGIFVMGIVMHQIHRTYSDLGTEQLSALKE